MSRVIFGKNIYGEPQLNIGALDSGIEETNPVEFDDFVGLLQDVMDSYVDALADRYSCTTEEVVERIQSVMDERGMSFRDAFVEVALGSDDEYDARTGLEGIRGLIFGDAVEKPPVLEHFESSSERLYRYELYQKVELIAQFPRPEGSICTEVLDCINEKYDIEQARIDRESFHEQLVDGAEEHEDYKTIASEEISFREDMAALDARSDALFERVAQVGASAASVFSPKVDEDEARLTSIIISLDNGYEVDGYTVESALDEIHDYLEARPDCMLASMMDARETYLNALEKVDFDSDYIPKRDLLDKHDAYNNLAADIMISPAQPSGTFNDVEVREADDVDKEPAEEPHKLSWIEQLDAMGLLNDKAKEILHRSYPDFSKADEVGLPVSSDTESVSVPPDEMFSDADFEDDPGESYVGKELPGTDSAADRILVSPDTVAHIEPDKIGIDISGEQKVGLRKDADYVVRYAIAERITTDYEKYPAFGKGGHDLQHSILDGYDGIEKGTADNAPLSTELKGIVDKLEELGPRNGNSTHDRKVDELSAQKEDVIHRAGAIIAGTRTPAEFKEDQAVYRHHKEENYVHMRYPDGYTRWDYRFADNEVRAFTVEGSLDPDGDAAKYAAHMEVRNYARSVIPELLVKYEIAKDTDTLVNKTDTELYRAQDDEQRSQVQMDMIYHRIDICNEGVKAYGIIDTPPDRVEKEQVAGDDLKPMTTEEREIRIAEDKEKLADYHDAKDAYNAIKDKYLFRNAFVSYSRMKYDIEAYKAGQKGSTGDYISGGDIAMRVLEFTRTNIIDSVFEIALRSYFDKVLPPEHDKHVDNDDTYGAMRTVDMPRGQNDFVGRNDNGFVPAGLRDESHRPVTDNPGAGRFLGTDVYSKSIYDDAGIEVRYTGPKSEFSVTGAIGKNGEVDSIRVPSIRLLEPISGKPEDGRWYLIDPFGQAVASNVKAFVLDEESAEITAEDIERPHYKSLDVTGTFDGRERFERIAKSLGKSVDELKNEVSRKSMQAYVDRGLEQIAKHETYIKDVLYCGTADQILAVRGELDYLRGTSSAVEDRIKNPKIYDTDSEREGYRKYVAFAKDSVVKLEQLEIGLTARFDSLKDTLDMYRDVKEQCRRSGDPGAKLEMVSKALEKSAGHIDIAYYGVTKSDITAIDKLCESSGYKGSDLSKFYVKSDWPLEGVDHEWNGAKIEQFPDKDAIAEKLELRDKLAVYYDKVDERWPGLLDRGDRNAFVSDPLQIKEIVAEAGFLRSTNTDRVEAAGEARKYPRTENEELGRLGLSAYQDWRADEKVSMGAHLNAYRLEDLDVRQIPTPEHIQQVRVTLRDYSWGVTSTKDFGTREVGPDLDWSTVRPSEILRDPDGKHFYVRIEGSDKHIPMSIEQTIAYMNGYMDKTDISSAFDKYLDISRNSSSTYSFATDFLEINKYCIDPADLVSVYADKLSDFLVDSEDGVPLSKYAIETVAECLASAKDSIIQEYADVVADKLEAIISDTVDKAKNDEAVSAFVDKVAGTLEPVIEKSTADNVDVGSVELAENVAERLDGLLEKGISPEDVDKLTDIAKTLDVMFDGYSDTLRAVIREATDLDSKVDNGMETARDDAVIVAADDASAADIEKPEDDAEKLNGVAAGGSGEYRADGSETPGIDKESGRDLYGADTGRDDDEDRDRLDVDDDRQRDDDDIELDSGLLDTVDEMQGSLREMLEALETLRDDVDVSVPDTDSGIEVSDADATADGDSFVDSTDIEGEPFAELPESEAAIDDTDPAMETGPDFAEAVADAADSGDVSFVDFDDELPAPGDVAADADMSVGGVADDVADPVTNDYDANFDAAAVDYDDPFDNADNSVSNADDSGSDGDVDAGGDAGADFDTGFAAEDNVSDIADDSYDDVDTDVDLEALL